MTCETENLVAAAIQDAEEMLDPLDGLIEKAAMDAARNRGGRVAILELDGCRADFWDLWNERGVAAVKNLLANAQEPGRSEHAGR